MSKNSLDKFELYYEELEKKKVAKAKVTKPAVKTSSKPKTTLKMRFESIKKEARSRIDNIQKQHNLRRKKAKKLTKIEKKARLEQKKRGIIGIGLLFVVVSIAYSTYMTNLFVDGHMMVVALAPQVIFAAITLLIAFYKIYK